MSAPGLRGVSDADRPLSEFVLRRRVQFYELDSAGIVHFSTYFRYLEEAEHAFWRAAGLSIAPPGHEVGYPRVSATCDYHRPLHFEDEFEVHIRIVAKGGKSIRYAFTITRGDTKIATGAMTIVCVRTRPGEPMKAVDIPAAVAGRFAVAVETDAQ